MTVGMKARLQSSKREYLGNLTPRAHGQRAGLAGKPIWVNPFADLAANDWRLGYREGREARRLSRRCGRAETAG